MDYQLIALTSYVVAAGFYQSTEFQKHLHLILNLMKAETSTDSAITSKLHTLFKNVCSHVFV